ncbi:Uncharacterised protein [Zhongshania aliphaticivorans]|uniref:Putative gamma-glutamylcyclotransferase n=1 Tax=Zhongshania aliphaticivorans TaxID=1470434 RepID=A0A5S9QMU6_9GAMM|nr:gamma-glutamylcyclotransferase family protein [Zhongshania aliphaticivorans]CAA0087511.1 Uncharacterised protein [Zhongshania aliphaticivorans]CAA0115025.1 Uncharacterised protein [Zhongshania aliphaticivorans]CAA0119828.1 Uncharacterised protein [Zhongshania aliphaticivorans]
MTVVFTYGSLMCDDIMAAVTGSDTLLNEAAVLAGYKRYAILDEAFPAVVAEPLASVVGKVYTGVDETNLARLDAFEGEWYSRKSLQVRGVDEQSINAEVYVLRPEYSSVLAPWSWSYEYFLEHGRQAFMAQYIGYQRLFDR